MLTGLARNLIVNQFLAALVLSLPSSLIIVSFIALKR